MIFKWNIPWMRTGGTPISGDFHIDSENFHSEKTRLISLQRASNEPNKPVWLPGFIWNRLKTRCVYPKNAIIPLYNRKNTIYVVSSPLKRCSHYFYFFDCKAKMCIQILSGTQKTPFSLTFQVVYAKYKTIWYVRNYVRIIWVVIAPK